ncbi:MAG TPA: GNAT family N-acetyltransferase [Dehalococcoidia bacterium]
MVRPFSVRLFSPSDQDQARSLVLEGMREHFGEIDPNYNHDLNDIAAPYGNATFLVAETDDQIVGTGCLVVDGEGAARIVRMSTAQAFRRTGVATAILTELMAMARARRHTRVWLTTHPAWEDARAFYLALGFREAGLLSELSIAFELDL